jgi:hypothetical protein
VGLPIFLGLAASTAILAKSWVNDSSVTRLALLVFGFVSGMTHIP